MRFVMNLLNVWNFKRDFWSGFCKVIVENCWMSNFCLHNFWYLSDKFLRKEYQKIVLGEITQYFLCFYCLYEFKTHQTKRDPNPTSMCWPTQIKWRCANLISPRLLRVGQTCWRPSKFLVVTNQSIRGFRFLHNFNSFISRFSFHVLISSFFLFLIKV